MKNKNNAIFMAESKFLSDLAALQWGTAPVQVEIGATINGIVEPGYIAVKDAPQYILSRILPIADALGVTYSVQYGRLLFDFHTARDITREEFFE